LLDAGAFLGLYHLLNRYRSWERLTAAALCAMGSLVAALFSVSIDRLGLCGLSGAAHGLMALCGLELAFGRHRVRGGAWVGMLCFVLVAGKSVIEAVTGRVFFAAMHLGSVGVPMTLCHLGGVLGGLVAFGLLRTGVAAMKTG
jgi:hypothetical protein